MDKQIQEMAEAFKLLADKTRLSIIALLKEQDLCVCDITEIMGMSQPNASQHLRKLKAAGLVNEQRKGQWVYYSLNDIDKPYIQCIYEQLPSMKERIDAVKGSCCDAQEEA